MSTDFYKEPNPFSDVVIHRYAGGAGLVILEITSDVPLSLQSVVYESALMSRTLDSIFSQYPNQAIILNGRNITKDAFYGQNDTPITDFESLYRGAEGSLKLSLQQLRAQIVRMEDQLNSDGNVDEDTVLLRQLHSTAEEVAVWRRFHSIALNDLENAKRAQVKREIDEFNSIDEFVW